MKMIYTFIILALLCSCSVKKKTMEKVEVEAAVERVEVKADVQKSNINIDTTSVVIEESYTEEPTEVVNAIEPRRIYKKRIVMKSGLVKDVKEIIKADTDQRSTAVCVKKSEQESIKAAGQWPYERAAVIVTISLLFVLLFPLLFVIFKKKKQ